MIVLLKIDQIDNLEMLLLQAPAQSVKGGESRNLSHMLSQKLKPTQFDNPIRRCCDSTMYFLLDNWQRVWVMALWIGVMAGLFTYKYIQYKNKAAFEVMGHCVCMAKGAAETLKFNMALILLPVCRNTITWLRNKTKLGGVVPFDDNLNFHKVTKLRLTSNLHKELYHICPKASESETGNLFISGDSTWNLNWGRNTCYFTFSMRFPSAYKCKWREVWANGAIFWGSAQKLLAFCEVSRRGNWDCDGCSDGYRLHTCNPMVPEKQAQFAKAVKEAHWVQCLLVFSSPFCHRLHPAHCAWPIPLLDQKMVQEDGESLLMIITWTFSITYLIHFEARLIFFALLQFCCF